jgi:hypothetical protein
MAERLADPAPAGAWHAWGRMDRRDPWRRLVSGATETEVLHLAMDMHLGCDWCILPAGRRPAGDRTRT